MSENYIQFVNRFANELNNCYSSSSLKKLQDILTDFLSYCENKNITVFNLQIATD